MSVFFNAVLKELVKIKREKEKSLQKKLEAAQIRFQENPCEELIEILNKCKLELEKVFDEKAHGCNNNIIILII